MARKIYLASPFFNDRELANVDKVERILREKGLEVFSPREFMIEGKEGSSTWAENAFTVDRDHIHKCDCLIMLYYGNYSDSGTAWECGYAYGIGKPVVVVQLGEASNLMVHVSCQANIRLEDLPDYDFETLPGRAYEGPIY